MYLKKYLYLILAGARQLIDNGDAHRPLEGVANIDNLFEAD